MNSRIYAEGARRTKEFYNKFCNCHHIFVHEEINQNNDNIFQHFGCIKCGLTTRKIQLTRSFHGGDELATKLYFDNNYNQNYHLFCREDINMPLSEAEKICQSIISQNENIDDETLKEVFEQKYDEHHNNKVRKIGALKN